MKLKSIKTRAGWVIVTLGNDKTYRLPSTDLWELGVALEGIFTDNQLLAVVPASIAPELVPDFRDRLKASTFYIQDRDLVDRKELAERRLAGKHVAGGKWFAEITINDIATDCQFTTLEELYQVVYQLIYRECTMLIGMARSLAVH